MASCVRLLHHLVDLLLNAKRLLALLDLVPHDACEVEAHTVGSGLPLDSKDVSDVRKVIHIGLDRVGLPLCFKILLSLELIDAEHAFQGPLIIRELLHHLSLLLLLGVFEILAHDLHRGHRVHAILLHARGPPVLREALALHLLGLFVLHGKLLVAVIDDRSDILLILQLLVIECLLRDESLLALGDPTGALHLLTS